MPHLSSRAVEAVAQETGLPATAARNFVRAVDVLTAVANQHEARCKGCATCARWRPDVARRLNLQPPPSGGGAPDPRPPEPAACDAAAHPGTTTSHGTRSTRAKRPRKGESR